MNKVLLAFALLTTSIATLHAQSIGGQFELYPDTTGVIATANANGRIDTRNIFFQSSLATNGRSCSTCHQADQAMSMTPDRAQELFVQTHGRDPLFAAVDGANCPNARTGDQGAHSLILSHGLIRVSVTIPANPAFQLVVVHDPYGCALTQDPVTHQYIVSEYRRPLPSTNLRFLSAVMFDGRESPSTSALNNPLTFPVNLQTDLKHQAQDAITTHFQGAPASDQVLDDIVAFEMGLYTAQVYDRQAGVLDLNGGQGGVRALMPQDYHPGINDVLGADPYGVPFTSSSMTLFSAWQAASVQSVKGGAEFEPFYARFDTARRAQARRDVAAGEILFNTAPITITGVRGLNDNSAIGPSLKGTCTTCHDAPNVGDHSLPLPLDIGIGHSPRPGLETDPSVAAGIAQLNEPDLPVFLVKGCTDPFGGAPVSFYTTDLGKGAVTGACADLNRVKGPILRGLAGRAPYFHNGAAKTLMQAVNFYNERFTMNLTDQQKLQLVAFLNTL
ncbi:MAG TPA: hypothetical protein VGI93_08040 [Steroidobacteraceae bacterium]